MESIENKTVPVSIKMLWTIIISIILGAISVTGIYINILMANNKVDTKNQIQDLQIQTLNLTVEKIQIDLKDKQRSIEQKQDKNEGKSN